MTSPTIHLSAGAEFRTCQLLHCTSFYVNLYSDSSGSLLVVYIRLLHLL